MYNIRIPKDRKPRKTIFKADRRMKVYEGTGANYKQIPQLRLQGDWLKELGFEIGKPINVHCEDGKLVITRIEETV